MQSANEELREKVQAQLFWDARLEPSAISIDVADGKVRLSGTVPSFRARQIAEYDIRALKGVAEVENDIAVLLPSGRDIPTDSNIKSSIESLFAFNADLDDSDIEVSVENGEVTLDGTVPALWQKEKAEKLVLSVDGVTLFTDRLAVVPTRSYVDELIARDIEAAFDRNVDVYVNTIDVQVSEGRVVLNGTVPDYRAFKRAEKIVRYTDGVVEVINNLVIEPQFLDRG